MDAAAEQIADRVPFLPGTGSAMLEETLELTAHAQEIGANAVLVITPYYARPTQEGLFAWYDTVAGEHPDLPVLIYNVPSRTAVDIAPETVARLRTKHANIVGIKETTKDFEHFSRVLHACGRDTVVLSGIELLCLPLLALGGAGFVSAVTNIAPQSCRPDVRGLASRRPGHRPGPALRAAPLGRPDLHRDQPRPGQMGAPTGRPARLRARQATAGRAQRQTASSRRWPSSGRASRSSTPRWPPWRNGANADDHSSARTPRQARPLHKRRPLRQRGRRHVRSRRPRQQPAVRDRRRRRPRGRGPRGSRRHGRVHRTARGRTCPAGPGPPS